MAGLAGIIQLACVYCLMVSLGMAGQAIFIVVCNSDYNKRIMAVMAGLAVIIITLIVFSCLVLFQQVWFMAAFTVGI